MAQPPSLNQDFVKENEWILIQLPSDNLKLVFVRLDKGPIFLGKFGQLNASELLKLAYGSTYEVLKDNTCRLVPTEEVENPMLQELEVTSKNNQYLVDDTTSQALNQDDIDHLKRELQSGEIDSSDLIAKIVQGSATFTSKNEFSQAKYLKRKRQKFSRIIRICKVTIASLCEYYFEKQPLKIKEIRVDTLSHLIGMSGVRSGIKVMLFDETSGLIAGALMERLYEGGCLLNVHIETQSKHSLMEFLNLPQSVSNRFHTISLETLVKLTTERSVDASDARSDKAEHISDEKHAEYLNREKKRQETQSLVVKNSFDSLVMGCHTYDPLTLLIEFEPYLKPSRPIVVYHAYKEILLPAFDHCRRSSRYVNVQLHESWLRHYQVLPGRMHPEMRTSGSGGYLLTMSSVVPEVLKT